MCSVSVLKFNQGLNAQNHSAQVPGLRGRRSAATAPDAPHRYRHADPCAETANAMDVQTRSRGLRLVRLEREQGFPVPFHADEDPAAFLGEGEALVETANPGVADVGVLGTQRQVYHCIATKN